MSTEGDDKVTVLIVEDDGDLRSMMRRELKDKGYRVLTAQDGEEAVDLVECISCEGPHLILTDLEMRSLDSLIRLAAGHPRLQNIPIVTIEPEYSGAHDERVRVLKGYEELKDLLT